MRCDNCYVEPAVCDDCVATLEMKLTNNVVLLKQAVTLFDQILPQAGRLALDIGLLNDFLIGARAAIKN